MMKRFLLFCAFVAPVSTAYLGCDGGTEEVGALDLVDASAADHVLGRSDSALIAIDAVFDHQELLLPDGGIEADADAGVDVDADADAEDAFSYSCTIMNSDAGATFGDASCSLCASEKCCDDVNTCYSVQDCIDRVNCMRSCDGGASCKEACKTAYPSAETAIAGLSLCLAGQCSEMGCGQFP
jgi:hypothetical protein